MAVLMMTSTPETMVGEEPAWVQIDRWGAELSRRQNEMSVEVCEWLLAARAQNAHVPLGRASFAEYAEWRLGIEPHTLSERLRVAEALGRLPALREELRTGRRHWSAVRELTRVAVKETEEEWLAATHGWTARQIEKKVAGMTAGQRPGDRADPNLVKRTLRFEVTPEVYATWREVVRIRKRDVDPDLSEEEILMDVLQRSLQGATDEGRSNYQVALIRCEDCDRVWQEARGEQVELPAEVMERVDCDAQHIGRVDEPGPSHVGRPSKASQTIPPAVRRKVMRRDGRRCQVPGCTNSVWVDLHHLTLREDGGDHDPENMLTTCGAHHARLHAGMLISEGNASEVRFWHADGTEYGTQPDPARLAVYQTVHGALVKMGYRESQAKEALSAVRSQLDPAAPLEDVLRAALQAAADLSGAGKGKRVRA
jgi:hypothetical protein